MLAIKSKRNIETVRQWIKVDFNLDFHIWGIEPTVNRALHLAAADELIIEEKGLYQIAPKGRNLIKLMFTDIAIYLDERKFLNELGKATITEGKIQSLSGKLF